MNSFLFFFFSLFIFIFLGCANSAPDGSSPRGYSQELVLGCRLNIFYIVILEILLFVGVAPEHLGKNLYLIKGSRSIEYFILSPISEYFLVDILHLIKFTSSLTSSREFSVLWVHCFHHVDTSCKWGTHVLRFFWRTYGNAYLSKNTLLPLYLEDLFSPHDFFIQRCTASPDSYINPSSTSVHPLACAARLFLFAKLLLRPNLSELPHSRTLLCPLPLMPPRTRLTRHSTPESKMATEDLEWERSKISNQDINTLKRLGLMKKEDAIRFPSEESYPNPPMEYRVSFVDHLIRGLSTPIHDFLRGLLFVYGIQLHQLTPNSILHISIFITLCECFLGVPPNWALWKRIFCLRRNGSHNVTYNIGGVVICVRTDVDYFDVKFPDSVQGWRKRWLYIHEESANSVEHNIVPFDGSARIQRRRSWDAEVSEEEKKATEALMSRIHQLQNIRGKELSGVQITAYFLRIRVQPLQARKNPLWTYSGENDANRISDDLSAKDLEKLIRRVSRLAKKDPIPSACRVEPYSSANPLPEVFCLLEFLSCSEFALHLIVFVSL
jgi:hypothetical protein